MSFLALLRVVSWYLDGRERWRPGMEELAEPHSLPPGGGQDGTTTRVWLASLLCQTARRSAWSPRMTYAIPAQYWASILAIGDVIEYDPGNCNGCFGFQSEGTSSGEHEQLRAGACLLY